MLARAQTSQFFALTARSVRPFSSADLLCYACSQITWTLPAKVSSVSVSLASARMADMLIALEAIWVTAAKSPPEPDLA